MSPRRAGYHRLSYTVWYEHVAGLNPALTREFEKPLSFEGLVSDADICRLHALYSAKAAGRNRVALAPDNAPS